MEDRGGDCLPNALTYGYLLKNAKKPEEVDKILERMEKSGCGLLGDTYNLILRMFMDWGDEKRVKDTWNGMERSGLGPDQRSYTIMVHGFYDKGRIEDALSYFTDMVSKGMVAEPRTKLLVDAMNTKLKEGNEVGEMGQMNRNISSKRSNRLR
ncbi:putative Pentatricopeptide repeat-containing protein [Abeliophyllum distichum]|uniref:Pentatricopeptide repeat-containing protein n=1 Tax=Abeliophyllum distichum TaxID=126358 RepID=A0ABD1QJG9_9LAMI